MARIGRKPGTQAKEGGGTGKVPLLSVAGATMLAAMGCSESDTRPVTYNRDIAPILFERCARCHRPGGAAPFSLLTYARARKRARQIAEVTGDRYMPPWLPEPNPSAFAGQDERRLSDERIALIRRWYRQGAPEGDPADLPETPVFVEGWQLGEPDLIVEMAEPFVVPAGGADLFRHFVLSPELERTRYVHGIEVRPGNKRVAHHAVVMVDPTWASRQLDARDPLPGFDGMVPSRTARIPDGHIIGWLPGNTPRFAEPGMAWRLRRGADILIQLHMLPSGKPEEVRPAVGLFFTEQPPTRLPFVIRLGSKTMDIPAGERNYVVRDSYRLPVDVQVTRIYPHAHYLGKEMEGHAVLPDGSRVQLIHIKDWDFNWQDQYDYVEPIALPAGTTIEMRFAYDNSARNPRNPNDPPQRVTYGPHSYDEMCDLSIQLVPDSREALARLARDFALKDLQASIDGYRKLIELHPAEPENYGELAFALAQLGRKDEALAQLQRTLDVDPDYAPAYYYRGTLVADEDLDRAITHFERALELDPQFVDAMNNLAAAYWRKGELQRSEALYRRAIDVRPDLVEAHRNLGRMLASRGDYAPALEHYDAVVRQQPEDARARDRLALLLSLTGRPTEALEQARQALDLAVQGGDDALAREIRQRLTAHDNGD